MRRIWTKEEALALIASNTKINETTGCHEWTGPRTRDGYGQIGSTALWKTFRIKGVHRLVVHLVHGHEFAGRHEQVLHACHNRSCCNPAHLSVGTPSENTRQAVDRGSFDDMPKGELHPRARHTNEQIREVKKLIEYGWRNCSIGQMTGIGSATVSQVRSGRLWSSVTI